MNSDPVNTDQTLAEKVKADLAELQTAAETIVDRLHDLAENTLAELHDALATAVSTIETALESAPQSSDPTDAAA